MVRIPAAARDAVLAAVYEAVPGVEPVEVSSLPEQVFAPGSETSGLLVHGPGLVGGSTHETRCSPSRWAQVRLGAATTAWPDAIPSDEWAPRTLSRIFRCALELLLLRREIELLRGDLCTVARRFKHDLYTPVGCIKTSASVLRLLPPGDKGARQEVLQSIDDSVDEISHLIEPVSLALYATAVPLELIELKMGEVVSGVLESCEAEIRQAGASVAVPQLWPSVAGVTKLLDAVWRALLANALKHGGPAARVQLNWTTELAEYRFWVADSGAGVPPAIRPMLFQPFEHLHSRHSPGLGLSVVQRLVSLLGGRCGYEPRTEGGSCFYFTLPRSRCCPQDGK